MSTPRVASAALVLVLGSVSSPLSAQLVPAPAIGQHSYIELMDQVYASLAQELNQDFNIPRRIDLTSGPCEQANALYVPPSASSGAQVVFCSELLDQIVAYVRIQDIADDLRGIALASQVLFVVLHEIGHAFVDALDLPVLGREEDVVDQLASLLFSDEPVLASWAADFWKRRSGNAKGRMVSMESFADEHGLDEQRFFNVICWAYGADPEVRGFMLEDSGLPDARAQRCPAEYQQMRSSWERLLAQHMRNPSALADLRPERNASGYWLFHESMGTADGSNRCTAAGTLTLWQMSGDLAGSMKQGGSCLNSGRIADNSAEIDIDSGTAEGDRISFEIASCRYEGTVDSQSRRRIAGSVTCGIGTENPFRGTWEAVR